MKGTWILGANKNITEIFYVGIYFFLKIVYNIYFLSKSTKILYSNFTLEIKMWTIYLYPFSYLIWISILMVLFNININ